MKRRLLVIGPGPRAERLCALAAHFGVDHRIVSGHFEPERGFEHAVVVGSDAVETVKEIANVRAVLVFDPAGPRDAPAPGSYRIGSVRKEITGPLSGYSVTGLSRAGASAVQGPGAHDTLIELDGRPFFSVTTREGCEWFYLAGGDVVDLDSEVSERHPRLDPVFERLIPWSMFIKRAFGIEYRPTACVMIDDPVLWKRYGFIDYRELFGLTREEGFSVTMAFIPWNYRRSRASTIDLFRANRDRISICVHGCDHAGAEFGTDDERTLRWKAALARQWMERHRERFSLPYDNVMVFPQGVFSKTAMRVLLQSGFDAAVNTEILATDYGGELCLRELLKPALTSYGLPLFMRRNPVRSLDLAYDLFFGRPALLVRHNGDFSGGWEETVSLVRETKHMAPNLEWMPIGKLVSNYCPVRRPAPLDPDGAAERGYDPKTYARVALRRLLCDFRDNVLQKQPMLWKLLDRCRSCH